MKFYLILGSLVCFFLVDHSVARPIADDDELIELTISLNCGTTENFSSEIVVLEDDILSFTPLTDKIRIRHNDLKTVVVSVFAPETLFQDTVDLLITCKHTCGTERPTTTHFKKSIRYNVDGKTSAKVDLFLDNLKNDTDV